MNTSTPISRRVAFVTLGCPKNTVDTEVMHSRLAASGWELVPDPRDSDATIVNTCGFIGPAREESVETILEIARSKEEDGGPGTLVVTGCMVTRYADELWKEIPEIDLMVDLGAFGDIDRLLEETIEIGQRRRAQGGDTYLYEGRDRTGRLTLAHTTYVKIAEGCDHRCAFCAIPGFKGGFKSREPGDVVEEIRTLVGSGVREINLISQDTSFYGVDRTGRRQLAALLRRVAGEVPGDYWLRLLYLYPTEVDDELIAEIASNPRVLPYVDMPLQHADAAVLKAMKRGGSPERLKELLGQIRSRIPGVSIRTTFIVGFPGETEAAFDTLETFIREERFENVGIFTYSPEEGTSAHPLGDPVPGDVKEARRERLMLVQQGISHEANTARVGSSMRVLVDRLVDGGAVARGPMHAPDIDGVVHIPTGERTPVPGRFEDVEVISAQPYDLVARLPRGDELPR